MFCAHTRTPQINSGSERVPLLKEGRSHIIPNIWSSLWEAEEGNSIVKGGNYNERPSVAVMSLTKEVISERVKSTRLKRQVGALCYTRQVQALDIRFEIFQILK